MASQEYSLAIGWNNAAGFIVVENTIVSGKLFVHVQGLGKYSPGLRKDYVGGNVDYVGEPLFKWLITKMTLAQYAYLKNTILVGLYSNRVTARTRFEDLTYYNVNTILTLPETINLTRVFGYYLDVELTFKAPVVI